MVPPDSHRISRVLWYSGALRESVSFHLPGCHRLWPAIPCRSINSYLGNSHIESPTTPSRPKPSRFGLVPVRSPLLRESLLIFFHQVLRCFSSLGWPRTTMYSSYAGRYSLRGLSHSEISGSKPVSGSPKLFAAVHVLHRLSSPRHPPCALCSLTLSLRHASR
jgi:hypothetical protein